MTYVRSILAILILSSTSLQSDNASFVKYGLALLQEHEKDHLENNVHKIIEVHCNDIGKDRIQSSMGPSEFPHKEEFFLLKSSSDEAHNKIRMTSSLPSSVDNSKLPSFPPIADQGSLGSCVAFGSTYYQATHEIGLIHGWDNKKSQEHILSPKWTYNLINGGTNIGSSPVAAYDLLSTSGAPTVLDFPYDNNYTAWDLNTDHWISAISYRMAPWTLIPGLGGSSPQNLTAIKQALNNGHVLTFGSFIDSWIYTIIKPDPENPNAPHVGEYAAFWMNGYQGGHFMTIVGYDDDIWIDINQNGQVDPGERGAFLIANSWGSRWGNNGFIWISYDAFLSTSAVPGGPSTNRVAAGEYLNSCLIAAHPKEPYYKPKLIAEVCLSQVHRNQIVLHTGVSTPSESLPSTFFRVPALSGSGGDFEFDGTLSSTPEMATFAIDLTDFFAEKQKRYHLFIQDNKKGDPTILHSFSLYDLTLNERIDTLLSLPKSYDEEIGSVYIDY